MQPDGQTEEVTFPETPLTANFSHDSITGRLDADGTLDMHYAEEMGGARAPQLRGIFMMPMDSATRGKFTRALAGRLYTGATGDSLVGFDGKDLAATARMPLHLRKPQAISHSAGTDILLLPVGAPVAMVNAANGIESLPPRQFAVDALKLIGPISAVTEMSITLPHRIEGARAQVRSRIQRVRHLCVRVQAGWAAISTQPNAYRRQGHTPARKHQAADLMDARRRFR